MVTMPMLVESPVGMVSSLFSLKANHSAAAGSVEMVTMVSAPDGLSRDAVTMAVLDRAPPCSSMTLGVTFRVTMGILIGESESAGSSLSDMVTIVSLVAPPLTPGGRLPNVSFTLSPLSAALSSMAVRVKLFSVSTLSKVTLSGTPL